VLNLRAEIQGIQQARSERECVRLLASALTGGLTTEGIDEATGKLLFDAAQRHGVLGLFPLRHPAMANALAAARARSLRALKFTHRVVGAIENAGIPVVVLKGAAAASRWPDPTLRQQSDVDVLVPKREKAAAARALIEAGVCSKRFLDSDQMHNDSLLPFDRSGFLVEVHHYLSNHHESRVDVKLLLSRRERIDTSLGPVPCLSATDEAVYLAMHATTHALRRLAWLVDLARLSPDWCVAAERAVEWGVALAVGPAWKRARELLGVPIPSVALRRVRVDSAHAQLAATVLRLADASGAQLQRFFERSYRVSLVALRSFPDVLRRKRRARDEERAAYESLR